MLKRITSIAILMVLLSPFIWSDVSAQVVIKERVEVEAPRVQVVTQQIDGDTLPLADCSVARGVTPPDLDRYLDAVGSPNRLIVKRAGVLRIEPMGGFAEFVRPQGPSSDPPVVKQIQGEVTITNDAGDIIALIDLSSFAEEGTLNRSYSCQSGGPIYYVTRNSFGPSLRIDVPVEIGTYDVSFSCASCTNVGSSSTQAFFATQTVTDQDGREYEQYIMRHKCSASAGLSYCFCHTAETDMALMNTFINFSFDPYTPDRMIATAVPSGPVAVGDSVQLFASFDDFRQTPLLEMDTVAVTIPDWEVMDFSVTGPGYLSYDGTQSDVLSEVPWPDVKAGMVWFVGTSSGPSAQIVGDNSGRLSSAAAMATASAVSCGITGTFDLEVEEEVEYELYLTASEDPSVYLPVKDDHIEITATVIPTPPPGSLVLFSLSQAHEFEFSTGGISPQLLEVSTSGIAATEIRSLDYWGVAKISATLSVPDGNSAESELQIPVDSDGDTIADVWELDQANGGSLYLDGAGVDDAQWDEESSAGNSNNGDGRTKIEEYHGILIGPDHFRMKPARKEIFLDLGAGVPSSILVNEIQSQLDIDTYVIEGLVGSSRFPPPAGSTKGLSRLGAGSISAHSGIVFVRVEPRHVSPTTPQEKFESGLLVVNGTYYDGSLAAMSAYPKRGYGYKFGTMMGTVSAGAIAITYAETIENIYRNNSIAESVTHDFLQPISTPNGLHYGRDEWVSRYTNSDLNSNGQNSDLVNPFDLLAAPIVGMNDSIDGLIGGDSEAFTLARNVLHEVAHTLGISTRCAVPSGPYGCHPVQGVSVMRSGIGPAASLLFTSSQIKEVRLK